MAIYDEYSSKVKIPNSKVQFTALTCFFISMKFYKLCSYQIVELLEFCPKDPPFTIDQLKELEWHILTTIDWLIEKTIMFHWLSSYFEEEDDPKKRRKVEDTTFFEKLDYITSLMLYYYDTSEIPPWESAIHAESYVLGHRTKFSDRLDDIVSADCVSSNPPSASFQKMRSYFKEKIEARKSTCIILKEENSTLNCCAAVYL
jgi:hypothetical protein